MNSAPKPASPPLTIRSSLGASESTVAFSTGSCAEPVWPLKGAGGDDGGGGVSQCSFFGSDEDGVGGLVDREKGLLMRDRPLRRSSLPDGGEIEGEKARRPLLSSCSVLSKKRVPSKNCSLCILLVLTASLYKLVDSKGRTVASTHKSVWFGAVVAFSF